jgi:hypothetical protein
VVFLAVPGHNITLAPMTEHQTNDHLRAILKAFDAAGVKYDLKTVENHGIYFQAAFLEGLGKKERHWQEGKERDEEHELLLELAVRPGGGIKQPGITRLYFTLTGEFIEQKTYPPDYFEDLERRIKNRSDEDRVPTNYFDVLEELGQQRFLAPMTHEEIDRYCAENGRKLLFALTSLLGPMSPDLMTPRARLHARHALEIIAPMDGIPSGKDLDKLFFDNRWTPTEQFRDWGDKYAEEMGLR